MIRGITPPLVRRSLGIGACVVLASCGGGGGGGGSAPNVTALGMLDTSFGQGGIAREGMLPGSKVSGVAVQPDRKVVVVGTVRRSTADSDMFAMRFTEGGALDTTFGLGGTGSATVDVGGIDEAFGVALRASDGAIVMVGRTDSVGGGAIAVAVLTSSGLPDLVMNGTGSRTIDVTTSDDEGRAVAVLIDDRIVVGGNSAVSGGLSNFMLYRMLPDGTLDIGTEHSNGVGPATATWGGDDRCQALALDPISGDIVLAGFTDLTPSPDPADFTDFAVARFLPTGALDTTFDGDGRQTASIGARDEGTGVHVDLVGKTIVTGHSPAGLGTPFTGVRFTASGALDSTWNPVVPPPLVNNGQGRFRHFFSGDTGESGSQDTCTCSLLQPDGRLVMAGFTADVGPIPLPNAAILRLMPDGLIDWAFGPPPVGGRVFDFSGTEEVHAVARDDLGRIVMAGTQVSSSALWILVFRIGG